MQEEQEALRRGIMFSASVAAEWKAVVAISGEDAKKSVQSEALGSGRQIRITTQLGGTRV